MVYRHRERLHLSEVRSAGRSGDRSAGRFVRRCSEQIDFGRPGSELLGSGPSSKRKDLLRQPKSSSFAALQRRV